MGYVHQGVLKSNMKIGVSEYPCVRFWLRRHRSAAFAMNTDVFLALGISNCEYHDGCEWREDKALEFAAAKHAESHRAQAGAGAATAAAAAVSEGRKQ